MNGTIRMFQRKRRAVEQSRKGARLALYAGDERMPLEAIIEDVDAAAERYLVKFQGRGSDVEAVQTAAADPHRGISAHYRFQEPFHISNGEIQAACVDNFASVSVVTSVLTEVVVRGLPSTLVSCIRHPRRVGW